MWFFGLSVASVVHSLVLHIFPTPLQDLVGCLLLTYQPKSFCHQYSGLKSGTRTETHDTQVHLKVIYACWAVCTKFTDIVKERCQVTHSQALSNFKAHFVVMWQQHMHIKTVLDEAVQYQRVGVSLSSIYRLRVKFCTTCCFIAFVDIKCVWCNFKFHITDMFQIVN